MFTEVEARRCREDFPSLELTVDGTPLTFLDGPAGTQVPTAVMEAITSYYSRSNANTGGAFLTSRETDWLLQEVREATATFLGAHSWRTVSFGQNMTTLTFALARALGRTMHEGDEIVITELDHEANRGPWLGLRDRGVVVREVAMRPDGTLDPEDMERKINSRTRLVAVGMASNAVGTVNDVRLASELSRRVGAWLLLDAVHYAAHFPLDVHALEADFLLCSAYKFYGPHVGILYSRPGLLDELETDHLITSDSRAPWRIETGTLNHAALAGVRAAIHYIASWGEGDDLRARIVDAMEKIAAWEHSLARRYHEGVSAISGVTVHGPGFEESLRAPTVSISMESLPADEVAGLLAKRAIAVWSGDFYARRAVEVLGLAERGGILRTGFSMYNLPEEVDRLMAAVGEIAAS